MGPDALRTAGITQMIREMGHSVVDLGNMTPDIYDTDPTARDGIHMLRENIGWTRRLCEVAEQQMGQGFPIFMGGDHALSAGSVSGVARYAVSQNRPLFVLWLDAHSDFHTPKTSSSGNLHGTPVAYITGQAGFEDYPPLRAVVPPEQVGMIGLRSVDPAEKQALQALSISIADMRLIDEFGIKTPLVRFLERVGAANGLLHVSLDVDFLDPSIAPAVGTTVPGGATTREAHLVMELLSDSGLMTSIDLVELNPFLDERGRTAQLMVDLLASGLGRRVFDRNTRPFM
ncbi:arginase [Amylibacter marinus]|uniref:Arginase n=2 Tax=Amylibacter marinus TaxID=1475483 RepID=A0ABQ5VSI0_9RHOB|nr:arginase [Amylibacter marinus]